MRRGRRKVRAWQRGREIGLPSENGDPRIGFVPWSQKAKGQSQEFLRLKDLDKINPSGRGPQMGYLPPRVMGVDNRVYESRYGLLQCMVPAVVVGDSKVYVDKVDWKSFPPLDQLAYLFDNFFSKYDREVLMLVGKKRDGSGWLYHVPMQEGSGVRVEWEATDEEMARFSEQARWIGTLHVHPGDESSPSYTDIDDWAEPEKSGLHLIFGREGSYTICGAIAGKTFVIVEGNLSTIKRTPVGHTTSQGRSLEVLLTTPKPVRSIVVGGTKEREKQYKHLDSSGQCSTKNSLRMAGALKVSQNEMGSMKLVFYGGDQYLLTQNQWCKLKDWCDGVCPMPAWENLVIRPKEGGT